MVVEQDNEVSPLTHGSRSHGSHHHRRTSLSHESQLSPASQQSSHSPSNSSSPQDDSSSPASSPNAVILPRNINHSSLTDLQKLQLVLEKRSPFPTLFDRSPLEMTSGSVSRRTHSDSGSVDNGDNRSNGYNQSESSTLLVNGPLRTPDSRSSGRSEADMEEDEEDDEDKGAGHYEAETREHAMQYGEESLVSKPNSSICSTNANAPKSDIFRCLMCSLVLNSRHQYNEHMVACSQRHSCTECSFIASDFNALRTHLHDAHGVDELSSNNDDETPKVNSQGKYKEYKCKQCQHKSITKKEFWEHAKTHIRTDKMLTCHKCPFITEYKHHLEYHIRNHYNSKPYKCDKCPYMCVNKSMLNSHLKSHSAVYQYRCEDCSYATKYCHSLKLHLRKYDHIPAVVLDLDGTPNPLPIIDVYGTRRGPKTKSNNNSHTIFQPNSPLNHQYDQSSQNSNQSMQNNNKNNKNNNANSNKNANKGTGRKERSKVSRDRNNANGTMNNAPTGSGSNRSNKNGSSSPTLSNLNPYYQEHNSPPLQKYSHTATSASENNSDSDQDSNFYRRYLYPQRQQELQPNLQPALQQQFFFNWQNRQTPQISPSNGETHGMSPSSLLAVVNGDAKQYHLDKEANAAAIKTATESTHVAGRNSAEFCSALNHLFAVQKVLQSNPSLQELANRPNQVLSQSIQQALMLSQNPIPASPLLNGNRLSAVPFQFISNQSNPQVKVLDLQPLDLTNSKTSLSSPETPVGGSLPGKRKRKGKAVRYCGKVDYPSTGLSDEEKMANDRGIALDFSNNNDSSMNNNTKNALNGNVRVKEQKELKDDIVLETGPLMCKYCGISFPVKELYLLHMKYHSGDGDPFLCSQCGKRTQDSISFYLHLTKDSHSDSIQSN